MQINWTHIMFHHSGSEDDRVVDWQEIRDWHVNHNGWVDTGYHFGCEFINDDYEVLIGRPLTMVGAHCPGMNDCAIGICLVGDFMKTSPNDRQIEVVVHRIVKPLMEFYEIPRTRIVGHKEFRATDCPGRYFDIEKIRRMCL